MTTAQKKQFSNYIATMFEKQKKFTSTQEFLEKYILSQQKKSTKKENISEHIDEYIAKIKRT